MVSARIALLLVLLSACLPSTPLDEGGATWALAPDASIGPDTADFTAMVTEQACASGQTSAGRVIGPEVEWADDAVTVTFRVRRLAGEQTCPGNPPTPVVIALDEPLGGRTLLDGGREPPAQPPVCANPESCE
jgi:hypothetical protein